MHSIHRSHAHIRPTLDIDVDNSTFNQLTSTMSATARKEIEAAEAEAKRRKVQVCLSPILPMLTLSVLAMSAEERRSDVKGP